MEAPNRMNDISLTTAFSEGIALLEHNRWEKMLEEYRVWMEEKVNALLRAVDTMLFIRAVMSKQRVQYVYSGMRTVQLTLMNGLKISVSSASFILVRINGRGRPRRRRKGVLFHPALELLGFIDRKSPGFLSMVGRAAVSSSSFQTASDTLLFNGIKISPEQVRKITYKYADLFLDKRVANVLDGSETQAHLRLEITIDGGRTRIREDVKLKNKRRKKGSYKGSWREPIVLSIRCLNNKGELAREVPQLIDATMKPWKGAFALLEEYLRHYNLKEADQITFIADGSQSIWRNVGPMTKRLGIHSICREVVDHMHTRQNMNDVLDLMAKHQSKEAQLETKKRFYNLLWVGNISEIRERVITFFGRKIRDKKAALKKLDNYFANAERFAYSDLKEAGHPIGSGTVESAVRRLINLKIKSSGSFWYKENCERMLFLRSQFLTKRWNILQDKLETERLNLYDCSVLQEFRTAS